VVGSNNCAGAQPISNLSFRIVRGRSQERLRQRLGDAARKGGVRACGAARRPLRMEVSMRVLKLCVALATISLPLSLIARAAGPGECGQYMYWKDGKCMDARNPTPEAWTDKMAKKKATW